MCLLSYHRRLDMFVCVHMFVVYIFEFKGLRQSLYVRIKSNEPVKPKIL